MVAGGRGRARGRGGRRSGRPASTRLDSRIRTAYQFAPGGTLEALLGAGTFADLEATSVYTRRTVALDTEVLRESW
jgi:hypothetical protein